MYRTSAAVVFAAGLASLGGVAAADEPETADAAMTAAESIAQCASCDFVLAGRSPGESARRGLISVGVDTPPGGGYTMLMAYTGTRWARLWEGNGSTQNVDRLPSKAVICMLEDGWTNIRKGPGLNYRRVGKVTRPTVKKVLEARLTKAVGRQPGEAWYRISYNGRKAWVQNLRTISFGPYAKTAAASCEAWKQYYA